MNKEYYKELIEQIVNAAWAIKVKYSKYKPQNNLKLSIITFMSFTLHESNGKKISAMIYYSYWLVLGCLYE